MNATQLVNRLVQVELDGSTDTQARRLIRDERMTLQSRLAELEDARKKSAAHGREAAHRKHAWGGIKEQDEARRERLQDAVAVASQRVAEAVAEAARVAEMWGISLRVS